MDNSIYANSIGGADYMRRRIVAAQAGGLDADAKDYFARAEEEASDSNVFDLSAINASYTKSYVKNAWSEFFKEIKGNLDYSKITEIYALVGVGWPALMVKPKYATAQLMTNVGFVSGDYLAAGVGAGLNNLSTNYLVPSHVLQPTGSMGFYATNIINQGVFLGSADSGATNRTYLDNFATSSEYRAFYGNNYTGVVSTTSAGTGFVAQSRTDVDSLTLYKNGITVASDAASRSIIIPNFGLFLFARNQAGVAAGSLQGAMPFVFTADGLSGAEIFALSTAVNTLMTRFGCNVY